MMVTLLGWMGMILFVIGFVTFIAMNLFIEFTPKGKVRFIATVVIWGIVSITLVVSSFIISFS